MSQLNTEIDSQLTSSYFGVWQQSLNPEKYNKAIKNTSQINQKIYSEIDKGQLLISSQKRNMTDEIQKISRQIQTKSQIFNKDLLILQLSVRKNSHSVRGNSSRAKSVRILKDRRKTQLTDGDFQEYKYRQLSAAKKLRQLKRQKEELHKIKLQSEEKKRLQLSKLEDFRLKSQQQTKKLLKNKKMEQMRQRIQLFNQRRQFRVQSLKKNIIHSTPNLPKYKVLEQEFKYKQQAQNKNRVQSQKELARRKKRQYQPEAIKAHQKEYIEHLKDRFSKNSITRSRTEVNEIKEKQLQSNFKVRGPDPLFLAQKKKNKQKIKKFQQHVSRIKLKTNLQRQIQIEIAKDKSKNPFKYHFLRQKANLSDYEIYQEFDVFCIDSNKKQLGDKYLKQIGKKNKNSRVKSTESSLVRLSTASVKKEYKNYLGQVHKNLKRKPRNSIQQLLNKYEKSQVLQILQNKSEVHRAKAMKKIEHLNKNIYNYKQSVKTEEEIDQQFLQCLKAKLKCVQIK